MAPFTQVGPSPSDSSTETTASVMAAESAASRAMSGTNESTSTTAAARTLSPVAIGPSEGCVSTVMASEPASMRTVAVRASLSAEPSAGVVAYAIRADGDMPARWYHPDLDGRLGEGLSTDGPHDGLEGLYRAEYASASGAFEPLVKELRRVGEVRLLAWRTSRETLYEGVGLLHGATLVAGWATPRASIEVVRYVRDAEGALSGTWAARARAGALKSL